MTTKTFITTLALVLTLILGATAANAAVIDFEDTVNNWSGWGTRTENKSDTIGVPNFTTGQIGLSSGDTMSSFTMNYTVNKSFSAFNGLNSGDLFINTNDDKTWDYVVKLNGREGGVANVYAINTGYKDRDGYVLGNAAGNFRDNHPASAIVDGLEPVAQVMWSGLADASAENKHGAVSVSGLDIKFDVLTIAYTVSCANDVVFHGGVHATPIPGAVWLLGSGLAGMLGLRRVRRS